MNEELIQPEDNNQEENSGWPLSAKLFVASLLLTALFHYLRTSSAESFFFELGFILSAAASISILISEACDPVRRCRSMGRSQASTSIVGSRGDTRCDCEQHAGVVYRAVLCCRCFDRGKDCRRARTRQR